MWIENGKSFEERYLEDKRKCFRCALFTLVPWAIVLPFLLTFLIINRRETDNFDDNIMYGTATVTDLSCRTYNLQSDRGNYYCDGNFKIVIDNITITKAFFKKTRNPNIQTIDVYWSKGDSKNVDISKPTYNTLGNPTLVMLFSFIMFFIFIAVIGFFIGAYQDRHAFCRRWCACELT